MLNMTVSVLLESHASVRQLPAAPQSSLEEEDNKDRCSFDRPRWPSNRLRPEWRKTGWPAWSRKRRSYRQKWGGWRCTSTALHPAALLRCRYQTAETNYNGFFLSVLKHVYDLVTYSKYTFISLPVFRRDSRIRVISWEVYRNWFSSKKRILTVRVISFSNCRRWWVTLSKHL